jgi:hypothetical protein
MRKTFLGLSIALASVLGFAGVAGATPATPESMAADAAADLTPIIIGVGSALVAVAVVRFGVNWVLRAVGRGGR